MLLKKGRQLSTKAVSTPDMRQSLLHVGWRLKGWLPTRVAAGEHVVQHDPQGEGVHEPVNDLVRLTQHGFHQLWGGVAQGESFTLEFICSMVVSS